MSGADLPVELALDILELAVKGSTVDSLPWAMSLLLLSRLVRSCLIPHIYYNLRITPSNSDAFLENRALLPYLRHVHTLQFVQLAVSSQQRAWATSAEHMQALAHVKHFRGPRKIFSALAKYPSFTPTRWRSDPPFVAESLLGPAKRPTSTVRNLTHCYLAFLSPIRIAPSQLMLCPAMLYICFAPHAVANTSLFLSEVCRLRAAPHLQRMVVRLGFLTHWTADGQPARTTCAKQLRAAGAQWKDPNIFLDESTRDFDLDDDEQWFLGEPLWVPDS